MMTKKDYILLAETFAKTAEYIDYGGYFDSKKDVFFTLLADLIDELQKDNDKFDRLLFVKHINKVAGTNLIMEGVRK
jgi:hypothetical protein